MAAFEKLTQREVSRRMFVKAMGAVAAAAPFAAGLTGCGSQRAGGNGSSSSSGDGSIADTLTYGQASEPSRLDPALISDGASSNITSQIYETLVKFDEGSTDVVPALAESYDISEDGQTYTFKLHKGIKFSDGTDFNSDAVRRTIERQLENNRTDDMSYASFNFGDTASGVGVDDIQTPDDYTVEIHLRAVQTPFIKNLAMGLSSPIVSPAALDEYNNDLSENPVGTGPYVLDSWNRGESVTLKRNEDYWDDDNAGKTPTLVFRFIAETASRVTALSNGEIDICEGVDVTTADQVESSGMTLMKREGLNINYCALNTAEGAMADAEARRAVRQAINVEEMVKALYGDYAVVATSFMPSSIAPYADKIKTIDYDPDAARATFQKLGITSLTMMTYSTQRQYNTAGGQALAESIQGYLSDVGVDLTINSYDWTTFLDRSSTESYDLICAGWMGDNGDPDNFMNLLSVDDVSMNRSHYHNEEYNDLIKQGLSTPDGDDRDAIYQQLEQIVADDVPLIPISHAMALTGLNPAVNDFDPDALNRIYLHATTKSA